MFMRKFECRSLLQRKEQGVASILKSLQLASELLLNFGKPTMYTQVK